MESLDSLFLPYPLWRNGASLEFKCKFPSDNKYSIWSSSYHLSKLKINHFGFEIFKICVVSQKFYI